MDIVGEGSPTVVFENGGGDDASVWANIEPQVRRRLGVRTVLYDRAGLGKSDPKPGAYNIEDEKVALKRALDNCGVRGPIVLVAHSYGGFVSKLMAARDPRVAGVVFIDANLPEFFDQAEVGRAVGEVHAPVRRVEA
jgi:pimeloyl-ACP methyl ester carboxylesterase